MTKPTNWQWQGAFDIATDVVEHRRDGFGTGSDCEDGFVYPIGDDALAPLVPTVTRRKPPMTPMNTHNFAVAVGDASRCRAPGETFELTPMPLVDLRPVRLQLTQFVDGRSEPCRWPIEACYVGARFIDGAMALYDGHNGLPTCKLGQTVRLRLRNPLAVPAAVCGALIGRTYRTDGSIGASLGSGYAPGQAPLTAAQLEEMVHDEKTRGMPRCACGRRTVHRCKRCGSPRCAEHLRGDDGTCCLSGGQPVVTCSAKAAVSPLTTADLERMVGAAAAPPYYCVDCDAATPGYRIDEDVGVHCEACARKHRASPLVSRAAAGLPDPATVPTKRGVEVRFPATAEELRRALGDPPAWGAGDVPIIVPPPAPRRVVYCEAAPPPEVVAAATCLLDGDEVGAPARHPHVVVPLVYTARMRLAWERHRDHEARWTALSEEAAARGDRVACERAHRQHAARMDRDVPFPPARDAFGGAVVTTAPSDEPPSGYGYRCRLCGAWLRSVTVTP